LFYSKRIPPLILLKPQPTKFVLPFKQEWWREIKFIFFSFPRL
jgi:hypothetical protein